MATQTQADDVTIVTKAQGPGERLLSLLHSYPLPALGVLLLTGISIITLQLFYFAEDLKIVIAREHASLFARTLNELQGYYSRVVAEPMRKFGVEFSVDYHQRDDSLPFPATMGIEFSRQLSELEKGQIAAKLYSDYPFTTRTDGGLPDAFAVDAMQAFRNGQANEFVRIEPVAGRLSLRYASPLTMKESCLACHNTMATSPKTDWRVGDVRGIREVILPLDYAQAQIVSGIAWTFVTMALMTFAGIGLLALSLGGLRRSLAQVREQASALQAANHMLERVNMATSRFVPREFLASLGKDSILTVEAGDHIAKNMTVMFSDIRSFTTLSERMSPEENFQFVNRYLGLMGPVIREHHGFIDKYIGDAIMALFEQEADDAVMAAVAMFRQLEEYNAKHPGDPIRIGVGLNTGPLMLGTVGESNRMDGTVISDAVNLAARIEGLTKSFGSPLLITKSTKDALHRPELFALRFVGHIKAKGKTQPVAMYEVLDAESPRRRAAKLATRDWFEQGVRAYHAGNTAAAVNFFEKCLARDPLDQAATLFRQRCHKAA